MSYGVVLNYAKVISRILREPLMKHLKLAAKILVIFQWTWDLLLMVSANDLL